MTHEGVGLLFVTYVPNKGKLETLLSGIYCFEIVVQRVILCSRFPWLRHFLFLSFNNLVMKTVLAATYLHAHLLNARV